jgi:hypothetical protein
MRGYGFMGRFTRPDGIATGHATDRPGLHASSRALHASRGGIVVFLGVLVIQHALSPELSVERDRISEYAVRGTGWLMALGFVSWALALAASAVLARVAVVGPGGWALAGLFAIAAGGMLLTASFPTQAVHGVIPAGMSRTTAGLVHDLASGAVLLALIAAALLSLIAVPGARVGAAIALAVGCPMLLGLPLSGADAPALAQRVTVLAACAWHWMLAGTLARHRASPLDLVRQ